MHDLHCKNADEMYSEILAQRVSELKETEKGIESMCEEMEKIYKEGETRGEARGELKERKKNTKALFQKGMSVKEIAEIFNEKEDIVNKWLDEE